MNRLNRTLAFALFAAALSSGCSRVTLVDDVDFALDWGILSGPTDALHSPYVAGAGMVVFVESSDSHQKMQGWTLTSSAPSVFTVGTMQNDGNGLSAACASISVGTAVLTVRDEKGNVQHTHAIEVKQPDSAHVLSHGPLLLQHPESEAELGGARIALGGTATFLVQWFAGAQRLAGNGSLSFVAPQSVEVTAEKTEFLVDRDWMHVTPHGVGDQSIQLFCDGKAVTAFPITVVASSEVAAVQLLGEDETGATDGRWLVVLAQAFDTAQRPLFGIEYTFDVDGQTQSGIGDIYRYEFKGGTPKMLTAHMGSMQASAMIHAGTGFVDSTNNVGCQAGGKPGGGALTMACVGIALAMLRRRNATCRR